MGKGNLWKNWSGTVKSSPEAILKPEDTQAIREIIRQAIEQGQKIRVVGSGHSYSDIVNTDGLVQVSMEHIGDIRFDKANHWVTVGAGVTLAELNRRLEEEHCAMENLGTIDAQTVVGAMLTATHGAGANFSNLPGYVHALTIMTADGKEHRLSLQHDPDFFQAAKVSFGVLGIITSVTIKYVAAFNLETNRYVLPLTEAIDQVATLNQAEHCNLWWIPDAGKMHVWISNRTTQPAVQFNMFMKAFIRVFEVVIAGYFYEFFLWTTGVFPRLLPKINRLFYYLLFKQEILLVLKSFEAFKLRVRIKVTAMEYALAADDAKQALADLQKLIAEQRLLIYAPIEVRFSKADDAWLSLAYQRSACYIEIICPRPYSQFIAHDKVFCAVESIMKNYGGRPHMAKEHHCDGPYLASVYPRWNDFIALREKADPQGIFLNDYLAKIFIRGLTEPG